jgi:hypothetical protein
MLQGTFQDQNTGAIVQVSAYKWWGKHSSCKNIAFFLSIFSAKMSAFRINAKYTMRCWVAYLFEILLQATIKNPDKSLRSVGVLIIYMRIIRKQNG